MNRFILLTAVATLGVFAAGVACANPVTFFGEDQNPGLSTAQSDAAHTQFLSHLSSGVGTEDFEGFSDNTNPPITLSFPGSSATPLTATLNGSGNTISGNQSGAIPHSGSEYYLVITSSQEEFSIDFGTAISAFGFYGSDISDSGSLLSLALTDSHGDTHNVQVTNNRFYDSENQLFFGFIDTSLSYTKIQFTSDFSGDFFGFDDMTIGDLGQVTTNPNSVPEPGNLAMLGLGFLCMVPLLLSRRRRVNCNV